MGSVDVGDATQVRTSVWSELKTAFAKHRVMLGFALLSTLLSSAVAVWQLAKIAMEHALRLVPVWMVVVGPLTMLALVLAYVGDQRALRRELMVPLSERWLFAGGVLALANAWPVPEPMPLCGAALGMMLAIVAVPEVFDWLARQFAKRPVLRGIPENLRSREALYAVVPWLFAGFFLSLLRDKWDPRLAGQAFVLLSAAALSILSAYHRRTLWNPAHARWIRALPHLAVLGFVPCFAAGAPETVYLALLPVAALGVALFTTLRLHRRVVGPRPQRAVVYDSIQSRDSAYCDVHGFAARLVATIERSDAGVFGLTGVRGAGKSALARRVLQSLRPRYFTLEITSPARHDADLGFFVSVCRAVAQRVRDDLRASFDPQSGVSGILAAMARNAALALLGACALSCLLLAQPKSWARDVLTIGDSESDEKADPERREKAIAIQLKARIAARLAALDTAGNSSLSRASWFYAIVPAVVRWEHLAYFPGFDVLPVPADADQHRLLHEQLDDLSLDLWRTSSNYQNAEQEAPDWLKGVPGAYAQRVARLVLPANSRCPFTLISHMLRCAATEAAALAGSATPTIPLTAAPVGLFMTKQQLAEFGELLGHYANSLPAHADALFDPSDWSVDSTAGLQLGPLSLPNPALSWDLGGAFWVSAALLVLMLLVSSSWSPITRVMRAFVNRHDLLLYQDAELFLEELSFSSSREATRTLSFQGVGLGSRRTLADRALTLPGLTARYQWFVRRVCQHYNGKLVIAIDELDKVHDMTQVQGLLSDIKGALFVEGTHYILSISEDAALSFRNRLSAGRDIFESTFDEVFEVPRMTLEGADAMLQARLKLGDPDASVVPLSVLRVGALLAGGIPREVLRCFRTLSNLQCADALSACRQLIASEVQEWVASLSNSKLSGQEVIALRRGALAACEAVRAGAFGRAFMELSACARTIDPDNLRAQIRSLPASESENPARACTYAALSADIQSCLRLQLLVTIGELVSQGCEIEALATPILECHAVLQPKPALAETLLAQLREFLAADLAAKSGSRGEPSHARSA